MGLLYELLAIISPNSINNMEGYLAEIRWFAANFAPKNWKYCLGQLLPISANSALFSLLGTTYGGDGRTTFALPNLGGRVAIGPGAGPGLPNYNLGQQGGEITHLLNTQEMGPHTHPATTNASTFPPSKNDSAKSYLATGTRSQPMPSIYAPDGATVPMGANSVTMAPNGGNIPHNNVQPYLGMNYIICVQGIFPSRN